MTVLVCAGTLIAGVLAAAPAASAGSSQTAFPQAASAQTASAQTVSIQAGRARAVPVPESVGARIAAAAAGRHGVDWAACPAGWGLAAPVQCGWVTVPVDYAEPFGATVKLAVDRATAT